MNVSIFKPPLLTGSSNAFTVKCGQVTQLKTYLGLGEKLVYLKRNTQKTQTLKNKRQGSIILSCRAAFPIIYNMQSIYETESQN